jgi:ribosomal protein S6
MPAPEHGESMMDALERRDREYDLAELQYKQLVKNPILQKVPGAAIAAAAKPSGFIDAILGGNIPKATKKIHLGLSNPGVMSNFGRISPITKEETEATMDALQNNLYKTSSLIRWYSKTAAEKKKIVDKLKGGLGDNKPDSAFIKKELKKGVKHETEHTGSKSIAKEIAKDHLAERNDYYSALEKAKIGSLLNILK